MNKLLDQRNKMIVNNRSFKFKPISEGGKYHASQHGKGYHVSDIRAEEHPAAVEAVSSLPVVHVSHGGKQGDGVKHA